MTTSESNTAFEFDPKDFLASFLRTAKLVFLTPKDFFLGMKKHGGFRNPSLFLAACVLVHASLTGFFLRSPIMVVKGSLLGILFPFLTAAILFFIITKLFKVPGSYETTFRVNAYAATISLLSWIPALGLFLEAYRLYLLTVGLTSVFAIKTPRAVLAILLTLAVFVLASGVIAHVTPT